MAPLKDQAKGASFPKNLKETPHRTTNAYILPTKTQLAAASKSDTLQAIPTKMSKLEKSGLPMVGKVGEQLERNMTSMQVPAYKPALKDNGLLDVSNGPTHLAHITQLNSIQSPLLSLAAEIRNIIWKYALGGEIIQPSKIPMSQSGHLHPLDAAKVEYEKTICDQRGIQPVHVPSGLGLLGVCRQTYYETSTHVYEFNTFRFTDFFTKIPGQFILVVDFKPWEKWTAKLLPGQCNAVTDVELDAQAWILYNRLSYRMRDTFPSLKRVRITTIAIVELVKLLESKERRTISDSERYVKDLFCVKEGEHVELVVDLVHQTEEIVSAEKMQDSMKHLHGVNLAWSILMLRSMRDSRRLRGARRN
ncbi:beta transducin [Kalmusia sp. IMI 367209]|nr:beta transducin [Kalmusia sp. IMI 367209]